MGLEKGTIEWKKWWSTDYYNKTYGIKKQSVKPVKAHSGSKKGFFKSLWDY
jgi:hypothetical protein